MGDDQMDHHVIDTIPKRILEMQRLEALFHNQGYLICQATGARICDFDKVVAIFTPLSLSTDQVMAVHVDEAKEFLQTCLLSLHY
ncbi:MAG: hypothetical protein Q8911_08085 [Bacillota bacterium]|nr:hypothetical protein [Bacillota bacterium]